jgi:uncharacterized membrane protein YqhA
MRPFTCCHTGREKIGAKTPMALLKAIGKESIAILSVAILRTFFERKGLTKKTTNWLNMVVNPTPT